MSNRGQQVLPLEAAAQEAARPGSRERPFPVSEVVRGVHRKLEREIGTIWVEGETSSVSRSSRGHLYFCLKDARSQIAAVMWGSDVRRLRFAMEDGLNLRCRGRLGIYERSGKFQLYVKLAEPAGLGADALALEQLKQKLQTEGLFDPARKRALPRLPRRIGVVTSRTGAAVRDVVRAVQRRFPVPILVADTRVQGAAAPRQIARAIRDVCTTDVDILIIGRGGGSAADLNAFNDEAVVRAVADCPVPTISAVGHEVDVSLTDLAADRRAATPTMAGEMAVPVLAELSAALDKERRRLDRELELVFRQARQDLDRVETAADNAVARGLAARRQALGELRRRIDNQHPRAQLLAHRAEVRELAERARAVMGRRLEARAEVRELERRLDSVFRRGLESSRRRFGELAARLRSLDPLAVLERGYALATREGHVITDAGELGAGDPLDVRLARGEARCRVESVTADPGSVLGGDDDAARED